MKNLEHLDHSDGIPRSYSAATIYNGMVFPCGQIPVAPDGSTAADIGSQTRQCLENLDAALQSAGSNIDSILQITVYLSNIDEFAEYDEEWRSFFSGHPLPPRTTIFVAGFRGSKRIEITAIAASRSEEG